MITTIQSIEPRQGQKGLYHSIVTVEGQRFSVFDPNLLQNIRPGMEVELTIQQQGRWSNVIGIVPNFTNQSAQHAPPQAQQALPATSPRETYNAGVNTTTPPPQPKTDKSDQWRTPDQIMRTTALECAVQSCQPGTTEPDIIASADIFFDYIRDGVPEPQQ